MANDKQIKIGQLKNSRRDFIKKSALGLSAFALPTMPVFAGPFTYDENGHLIPEDKKLSKAWIKSLYERGVPDIFTSNNNELKYIGMPVGGIGCGQLYMGGDGKLWLWHIFRTRYNRNPDSELLIRMEQGGHYAYPDKMFDREDRPVIQGAAIKVEQNGKIIIKKISKEGFSDISFRGEYPISKITYKANDLPVEVQLEAFSPFIPGELDKSSNPATILSYKVKNTSSKKVKVNLAGWLENAVCPYTKETSLGNRKATLVKRDNRTTLFYEAEGQAQLSKQDGYGSMSWSLYNTKKTQTAFNVDTKGGMSHIFSALEEKNKNTSYASSLDKVQTNALGKCFKLKPGEEKEVTFVLGWYFPHLNNQPNHKRDLMGVSDIKNLKLHYSTRFTSADDVANYICSNFEELAGGTRLWNKTYYNSTLPYWLLDRSFISINAMATATLQRFSNGRVWGWEGVECCPGTCQHVWQYAQGMARIFPEAERNLREQTDLASGIGFIDNTGEYAYRAENGRHVAHDGHCGTIMRMYREHKLSNNDAFLRTNYAKIKKSVQFIIDEDKDKDGLLEGKQTNTLDAAWYGPMGWISSLYLGALAAGKQMALEMNDTAFASICDGLLEKGRENIVKEVFNGEYFIHKPDYENHPRAINSNDGCHIDQVLGQSFALQLGLPDRVVPQKETKSALASIWKYNFAPDAFAYQKAHKAIKGPRIYAAQGEAATVMCTWPKGGAEKAVPGMEKREENPDHWSGPGIYFDEAMNGFEYQVAVHMIWEGLLEKGLATAKVIHDRYNAVKRNPFNEIECSDHYSRSMASYGVLLAVCGFDFHGPAGYIKFNPQITPENFTAPFTAAEGWGTFIQKRNAGKQTNSINVNYGKLVLSKIEIYSDSTLQKAVSLQLNGENIPVENTGTENQYLLSFKKQAIKARDNLKIVIG
ncbi:GH116 family glycosyl-hydrolase [Aureibaculum conchae]|uniref:GH116 family glycosyl-hydrolase n=1 Tax=Aureibaculum sp. 2308TA14-22 TaxID=3108392 RepID=UPI0033975192